MNCFSSALQQMIGSFNHMVEINLLQLHLLYKPSRWLINPTPLRALKLKGNVIQLEIGL